MGSQSLVQRKDQDQRRKELVVTEPYLTHEPMPPVSGRGRPSIYGPLVLNFYHSTMNSSGVEHDERKPESVCRSLREAINRNGLMGKVDVKQRNGKAYLVRMENHATG